MNISKSEVAAIKLSLMTEHNTATRGLTDEAIVKLAGSKGAITPEQQSQYLGAPRAKPEPEMWIDELEEVMQAAQETKAKRTPTKTPEQAPMAQPTASATQADLLAQLMQTMTPAAPTFDEARIIELINEHSPVKRIEVKTPSGSKVEIEQQTHACFERSLQHLQLGNQIFFYGRSGAGKSTTATHLAKALDTKCYIQGAILAKFEALGSLTATGYNKSTIRNWLENADGGLLCIDELDASCPRALVTLMSIFDDNGELTFPDGETFKRTNKHFLIVTANTTGAGASAQYMGRTRLDKATLNRFVMIEHDYDEQIENTLADKKTATYCRRFRDACSKKGFDGALITPRTIKQAGKVSAAKMSHQDKANMIQDILRQGLTVNEYGSITSEVGAY